MINFYHHYSISMPTLVAGRIYMINFYHHYSISMPTLVAGGILFVSFFLLFVYILKFVSFLLENEYGRFRLLRHTV